MGPEALANEPIDRPTPVTFPFSSSFPFKINFPIIKNSLKFFKFYKAEFIITIIRNNSCKTLHYNS